MSGARPGGCPLGQFHRLPLCCASSLPPPGLGLGLGATIRGGHVVGEGLRLASRLTLVTRFMAAYALHVTTADNAGLVR